MIKYEVVLNDLGVNEHVSFFDTQQEAAIFIVKHNQEFNDDRFYEVRKVQILKG